MSLSLVDVGMEESCHLLVWASGLTWRYSVEDLVGGIWIVH